MKKIYIAGPMTGLPESNYPAFNAAASQLRALGHEVQNPAENPWCDSWEGYMRLGVAQLVQCDCIVLLPGWSDSRGALIERQLAQMLDMEVFPLSAVGCAALEGHTRVISAPIDWSAA